MLDNRIDPECDRDDEILEGQIDNWMQEAYIDAILKVGRLIAAHECEKMAVMIAESHFQDEELGINLVEMLGLSDLNLIAIRDDRGALADMILEAREGGRDYE